MQMHMCKRFEKTNAQSDLFLFCCIIGLYIQRRKTRIWFRGIDMRIKINKKDHQTNNHEIINVLLEVIETASTDTNSFVFVTRQRVDILTKKIFPLNRDPEQCGEIHPTCTRARQSA